MNWCDTFLARGRARFIFAIAILSIFVVAARPLAGQSTGPGAAQVSSVAAQAVHVKFAAVLGGKPFACGEKYSGVGTNGVTVTPADLRFYISNVELLDAGGQATPLALDQDGTWQYRNIALVDLEDGKGACRNGNPAMHTEVTGSAPAGEYRGIRFTVGLPFELGHVDPTASPAPLNFTAMSWAWQAGFKFIRAELVVGPTASSSPAATGPQGAGFLARNETQSGARSGRASGFPVHIGSTGCASPSRTTAPPGECAHPNRPTVTLATFDVSKDVVVFDFDRLLSGSDVSRNSPGSPPGCMSGADDPDCGPIFRALGLPFGSTPGTEQIVFVRKPAP